MTDQLEFDIGAVTPERYEWRCFNCKQTIPKPDVQAHVEATSHAVIPIDLRLVL